MTVYKATELKNGSILKMESNVGATPKYYLNDKEITVTTVDPKMIELAKKYEEVALRERVPLEHTITGAVNV